MTIKKFTGKTKEEAIEKAKEEFGENTVVMNVKEIKPSGFFSFMKKTSYEVTAAIEEKDKDKFSAQTVSATAQKVAEAINLAADENIVLPIQGMPRAEKPWMESPKEAKKMTAKQEADELAAAANLSRDEIEKKLENLSNILEKKLSGEDGIGMEMPEALPENSESVKFMKMLYRTLLDNEVNEKYVNQILEETEKIASFSNSVDFILSNVYQKMILKFGEPSGINLEGKKPKVVFFIGPTGVGKTTTIAKIASKYKVEYDKKVAFLTADTYRIAATEQLRIYANILDSPINIVYSARELNQAVERVSDNDMIFVDTAGFSHRNEIQRADIKTLINGLSEQYEKEVFLVLSATTKYKDLLEIVDSYREIADYRLIFTKLDETSSYGNLLNARLYSGAELAYVANGQNVPDDIEIFNSQTIVKQLLGGK